MTTPRVCKNCDSIFILLLFLELAAELYEAGLEAEADSNQVDTFNKRIRNAQIEQWNFILVVGAKEQENGTVAVRTRDTQQHGVLEFSYVKNELMRLHNDKVLDAENDFKGEKKEKASEEK
jgi:threonyl-tRNA synthetase